MSSEESKKLNPADCIPATNLFDGAFERFKAQKEAKQPSSKPASTRKPADSFDKWDKDAYFISGNPRADEIKIALSCGTVGMRCYVACLHFRGMNGKNTFHFTKNIAEDFWEISEQRRRDGLKRLEAAGLITVKRQSGASPLVTMIWQ